MNKLSKRAISILVIATFLLSMIPLAHAQAFDIVSVTPVGNVDYGDILVVTGEGVSGGAVVNVFWDYASGTNIHLLNTTEGNPDGSFDCDVKVPSDKIGNHYIWATNVATGETVKYITAIPVIPKIKLSPSSGLVGDEITVKGYGFLDESEVTITFDVTVLTTAVETDELGYFAYDFDVPIPDYAIYTIVATDSDVIPNVASAPFTIGASISLNPEEGPTGTVVSVSGRGWTETNTITFSTGATPGVTPVAIVGASSVTVTSGDKFSANIVIPGGVTEGEILIWATEGGVLPVKTPSSDTFEVTGLPEIEVDPTYGSPGATITVTGSNFTQIAGTEVVIELWSKGTIAIPIPVWVADLVIAETNSDGTFEETFMSPAVAFKGYDVYAEDTVYHIADDDAFKVGLIALIINPTSGEAGTKTSITGIGFTPGSYNVTFGTKLYEDYGTVSGGEAISDTFYVPNVEPGTYEMTIIDVEENELTAIFLVTAVTEVILDPAMAPNDYNMTIKGYNFADKELENVEFILYNATDEWDMTVQTTTGGIPSATQTGADGNFTAWWEVFPEADLSIGDYTVNVTGYDDFFIQVPFSVVEARVDVAPRKALFDRGDTIQFNVNNDFKFLESYMRIWDPYDNLYWETGTFVTWLKVGDIYTVPYYLQTSGMNPMELTQDAPMGTWFYIFYEEGTTQLVNGTFEVGPSSAAQIGDMLEDVASDLAGLSDDMAGMSDDFADDMAGMSADFADDMAAMSDDFADDIAGLANDIAQATDAGQSALDAVEDLAGSMTDLGEAMSDMTDLVSDTSDAAQSAADAANDAVQAAQDAQEKTSGLTSLVYGAILASLIAALAAIVSLMQISKRIAG